MITRSQSVFLVAAVVLAIAPGVAAAAVRGAPNHKISHSESTNWSGYAVSGPGPYTTVSSNWTQPAVNCLQTPTGWSSFWVGLDGDTTRTVEQTGTEADCSSGSASYYGWYEMYPKFPVNYANPVSPGDLMSASVAYAGKGRFELTITDHTQGWSQTVTPRLNSARLGSAEVIAEAPSSSGGVLPLADFQQVGFSAATVNGSLLTSATPGIDPITMVTSTGTVKAEPSAIRRGRFTDTWYHQ
ncbi:MAG TPA: G1 family glutamic endopeptidase [Solirubrobacteraceae bacterium]|nr:G1 family glutamic endopeptidase [Solirubrobacteraceae bacterium]